MSSTEQVACPISSQMDSWEYWHLPTDFDRMLATLVHTRQDAVVFMEYGLEESSQALVASCLEVLLKELPGSLLQDP